MLIDIYIIENLQPDEPAAAGHHRFEFVEATGSPVRSVAVVSVGS